MKTLRRYTSTNLGPKRPRTAIRAVTWSAVLTLLAALVGASPAQAAVPFSDYIRLSTNQINFGSEIRFGDPVIATTYTLVALQDVKLSAAGWYSAGPTSVYGNVPSGACASLGLFTSVNLKTGDVCTITASFNPNLSIAPGTGYYGGQSFRATGAGGTSDYGNVNYNASVFALDWTPQTLSFSGFSGVPTAAQEVTFTNKANVPIDGLTIGGQPQDFTVDLGTCASSIPVNGTCTALFTYLPDAARTYVDGFVWLNFSATGPSGTQRYTEQSVWQVKLYGTAYIPPKVADITVTKVPAVLTPPVVGEAFPWTVTVTNLGPDIAENTTAYDYLGQYLSFDHIDGATCTSDSYSARCPLGDLAAGAQRTLTVWTIPSAALPADTGIGNSASAYSNADDPDYGSNYVSAVALPPGPGTADLSLTKSADLVPPIPGGTTTWQLAAHNAGPDPATSVRVSDALPAGLTYVSGPPECTGNTTTFTCDLGDLPVGADWSADIVTALDATVLPGEELTNAAVITAQSFDPDEANNATSATTLPVALPALGGGDLETSIATPPSFVPGQQLDYMVTVTNIGDAASLDTTITVPLPVRVASVRAGADAIAAGWVGSGLPGATVRFNSACPPSPSGEVFCRIPAIRVGESLEIPVSILVAADAPLETVLRLEASAAAATDANPLNNKAMALVAATTATAVPGPGAPTPGPPLNSSPSVPVLFLPATGPGTAWGLAIVAALLILSGAAILTWRRPQME